MSGGVDTPSATASTTTTAASSVKMRLSGPRRPRREITTTPAMPTLQQNPISVASKKSKLQNIVLKNLLENQYLRKIMMKHEVIQVLLHLILKLQEKPRLKSKQNPLHEKQSQNQSKL